MTGVRLVPEAERDLERILEFIASDSVDAALKVLDQFAKVFALLSENPKAGHRREDLTKRPVRFYPVLSCLVVYLSDSTPIEIVRIFSASRYAPSIL